MANLHELAMTIGDFWLLAILSAGAAGLAVMALLSGTAKIKRAALPADFPRDADAQLDKYGLAFSQLKQVEKDDESSLADLAEQLKGQPASHLCLKAFEHFSAEQKRCAKK